MFGFHDKESLAKAMVALVIFGKCTVLIIWFRFVQKESKEHARNRRRIKLKMV